MSIARRKDRRSRRADVYVLGKTTARLWPNIEVIAEFAMTIVALAKARARDLQPRPTSRLFAFTPISMAAAYSNVLYLPSVL